MVTSLQYSLTICVVEILCVLSWGTDIVTHVALS